MDAIVGVWLTSLLGAAAFSTAGFVLGQRGVALPFVGLRDAQRKSSTPSTPEAAGDMHSMPTPVAGVPRSSLPPSAKTSSQSETPKMPSVIPRSNVEDDDEEGDRPTLVADMAAQAAVVAHTVATV